MAPSGVDKGRLEVDDLIVVNESQEIVEGNGRVSAETALHLAVVRETGAGAVLHSHSIAATVLSRTHQQIGHVALEGWEMQKGLEGVNTHETRIKITGVCNSESREVLVEAFLPHLRAQSQGSLVAGNGL